MKKESDVARGDASAIATQPAITQELAEAERALDASISAMRTHGHQGITWALYAADAKRVRKLRAALAKASAPAVAGHEAPEDGRT